MSLRSATSAARIPALLICLVADCSPRTDDSAQRGDTTGAAQAIVRRAAPVSAAIDSLVTTEPGAAATGSAYEAAIAAGVLPDGPRGSAITLAPGDTTDVTNYQAAAWWLGHDDRSPRERWRFSADFARYASGVLVLRLDTLLLRDRQQPPFNSAQADSVAVRGLRKLERFATSCRVVGHRTDDRILGVLPDSTPERWMAPRLAWFVDTVQARFRRMKPDSLACRLAENPD